MKGLLIVRAGDRSLHPHWLIGDRPRRWDLHISYFGADAEPFADRPDDVTLSFEKGPKFLGIAACLEKLGARLDDYDYIGFPDDDLFASQADWDRFFELCFEHKPELAQPALHPASFIGYPILVARQQYILRWTNFVEVMTPVFSRKALASALPDFSANRSGWGMDWYWPHLLRAEQRTLCVIDAAPVLHTREFGAGPLYRLLAQSGGQTPDEELLSFLAGKGVERQTPRIYAALRPDGTQEPGGTGAASPLLIPRVRMAARRMLSIKELKVAPSAAITQARRRA